MNITGILDTVDRIKVYNGHHENAHHHSGSEDGKHSSARGDVAAVVETLNRSVKSYNDRISFTYNDKANSVIMKIIDTETSEVVREIPAKDAVKLLESIQDYIGMLVDESR